jgi:single-strand DNA-binding protein
MSAHTNESEVDECINEVRLVGRLSQEPELRTLPSGDPLWTFRVVVPRKDPPAGSRATVDALDCAVWRGRSRRTVATWRAGDMVEVSGAVRRRFFRAGGGAVSRVEIEVAGARLIRRRSTS